MMLGDSIVERGDWVKLTGCKNIINAGVSSEYTAGLLARLNDVKALNPTHVFVMTGINDARDHLPTQGTLNRYARIVDDLRQFSQLTIVVTLPIGHQFASAVIPRQELAKGLVQLAQKKQIPLVDPAPSHSRASRNAGARPRAGSRRHKRY